MKAPRAKRAAYFRLYAKVNRDRILEVRRRDRKQNPEKYREARLRKKALDPGKRRKYDKKYRAANLDKVRARRRMWYAKNRERTKDSDRKYRAENKGYEGTKRAARRAAKLQAMPSWVDRPALRKFYVHAVRQNMTVDHIVPLRHPRVCGLHVPWNLQLLSLSENSRKSNFFEI